VIYRGKHEEISLFSVFVFNINQTLSLLKEQGKNTIMIPIGFFSVFNKVGVELGKESAKVKEYYFEVL
jgi:hypothetical protein